MADLCIIIPCFNEANRINPKAFKDFVNHTDTIDFLFVNDGSNDETKTVLNTLSEYSLSFTVKHLPQNVGKAEAIRQGFLSLADKYAYVGYLDADLSTPLQEIARLYETILKTNNLFIMGSRVKRIGASIERRIKRHISGRIIATYIDSFILKLGIYDTQCGAKIIESKLAKELFNEPFKTKWLFDVELILRAKIRFGNQFCLDNFLEVPLEQWHDIGNSKITFSDILKLPLDFIKIQNHYR